MNDRIQEKIQRSKYFLAKRDVERPLLGCYIGGWEDLSRYSNSVDSFLKPGITSYSDVTTDMFRKVYDGYKARLDYDNDDFIRCFEPVPSIPWTEAALGCDIKFTGKNFWSQRMGEQALIAAMEARPDPAEGNAWIEKYGEFIDFLSSEYPDMPIGQAILRGSLDMLCAAIGEEAVIYSFWDDPELVHKATEYCAKLFNGFIKVQNEKTPAFHGGSVMGQYYVWLDKPSCRIQQDAIALISPPTYGEFIHASCVDMAASSPRCLFHTHYTTHFVMDLVCQNPNVDIVQVTKDEGSITMEQMLPGMEVIQKAGKAILFKGKVTREDLLLMSKRIDKRGLAIGMVTDNRATADQAMEMAKGLDW